MTVSILLLRHSCTRLCYLLLGHSDVRSIVSAHNSYQCLRCVPGCGWSSSQTPTALADGGFACYFSCQAGPEAFRSTPAASSLCKTPLQKHLVCRRRPSLVPLLTKKDLKPRRYTGFLVNASTRRRFQRWAAPNYLPGSILHGGTRIISSGYLRGTRNTHILSASAACRRYHTLCLLLS